MTQNELELALEDFTGSETTILSEVRMKFVNQGDFTDCLIALVAHSELRLQRAAGWLILESLRDKKELAPAVLSELSETLHSVSDWQAILTLLQAVDLLRTSIDGAENWARFSEKYLEHKRPFLRAWSMNALCRLAAYHQEFCKLAVPALEKAMTDEAASVRARARKAKNLLQNST